LIYFKILLIVHNRSINSSYENASNSVDMVDLNEYDNENLLSPILTYKNTTHKLKNTDTKTRNNKTNKLSKNENHDDKNNKTTGTFEGGKLESRDILLIKDSDDTLLRQFLNNNENYNKNQTYEGSDLNICQILNENMDLRMLKSDVDINKNNILNEDIPVKSNINSNYNVGAFTQNFKNLYRKELTIESEENIPDEILPEEEYKLSSCISSDQITIRDPSRKIKSNIYYTAIILILT